MTRHLQNKPGKVLYLEHTSKVLKNNHLGDPHIRKIGVYLPHDYEQNPQKHYPLFMYLAGFMSSGLSALNWTNFTENIPERIDRLIHTKKMGPVIVVFPDCFTRFGGNQYINSPAIGNYADYIINEIIPFIDSKLRTDKTKRACFGHSSGGYGALVMGMKRPDI